jgi:sec-independent protein translocase protein TatC
MARNADREMELWEHLSELRSRIIRSLIYITVGMLVCWLFYDELFTFLSAPLKAVPSLKDLKFLWLSITEPFMVQMQISLVGGLILAIPLITIELWGFVAPGLTAEEKKGFHLVVPLSVMFFLLGVTCAYLILPSAFGWFAGFISKDAVLNQSPVKYITFVVKMLLAFGVVFQLPVVLMFLAWIGMVTSDMLKQNWRTAIVATSVVAAVATPSNDAFTMTMMAIPLAILYFASIWLVKIVERMRARRALTESAGMGAP